MKRIRTPHSPLRILERVKHADKAAKTSNRLATLSTVFSIATVLLLIVAYLDKIVWLLHYVQFYLH